MYNGNNQYLQQTGWQRQQPGNTAQGQLMPGQGYGQPNAFPPQQGYPVNPQQPIHPQQPAYPQQPVYPQGYTQGYPQGGQQRIYPQQPVPPQGYPQGYPAGAVPGQQMPPQGYPQRPVQPGYPPYPPMPVQPQPGYPPQGYPQHGYGQQPPYYQPVPGQMVSLQGDPNQEASVNNILATLQGLPWVKIGVFGLLPLLFLLGMFVPGLGFAKILFLIGALAGVTLLWVKPVTGPNLRLILSAGYGVLAVLTVVNLLSGNLAPTDTTNQQQAAAQQGTQAPAMYAAAPEEVPASLGLMEDVDTIDATGDTDLAGESTVDGGEAIRQMQSFFYSWSVNRTDDMVALTAPSWQSSVEDPKKALFGILANRTVLEHTVVNTTGTDADSTRTSTVDATIDKGNGRAALKYRFQVILLKEGGVWYVDPRSLTSVEAIEDAATATATPEPEAAASVTAPATSGSTKLYYNPSGGSKYHLDPNCPDVAARFTPLAGHFTFAEINDSKYVKLKRCATCNAPVRPAN